MSDYISKSTLVESIKAEIQCVEKEKQQYFEQGNFYNGNILVEKIQSMKLVMKIVANEPTLDEKEIIRKAFERVVERLEEYRDDFMENVYQELDSDSDNNRANRIIEGFDSIFEIIKEECGINE